MVTWIDQLSFAQKQRLQFIEALLIWEGRVQRKDVCDVFDVTPNHLTRDIKRYRTYNKNSLEYDVENRTYRRGTAFKPLFSSGSSEEYLTLLQAYSVCKSTAVLPVLGHIVSAESLPSPQGVIDPKILRAVMQALRHQTPVVVRYQSFRESEPTTRVLWPHTLVFTGDRWHIRAYDERSKEFRDFVLTRCISARHHSHPIAEDMTLDTLWNEYEIVEITPAPRLSEGQRKVVAHEYGMKLNEHGEWTWSVAIRKCLIGYFLSRHRLEYGGSYGTKATVGQHPHLALKNPDLAESYRFVDD